MSSSTEESAAGLPAPGMPGLFSRRSGYRHAIEQELVALASLVLAAATSTKSILAKVPEGAERQRLLLACEELAQAADAVVDPRSQIRHLSESDVEDALHAFVVHQEQSASVRSAAMQASVKPEPTRRAVRRPIRDLAASGARPFALPSRDSSSSWLLSMPARAPWRSAPRLAWSPLVLWRHIGRAWEGRSRARGTGA